MTKVAWYLLEKITPIYLRHGNKKITHSTKSLLLDFKAYLESLKKTHLKTDYSNNHSYLVGCIYRNVRQMKEREVSAYVKAHLHVATNSFKDLVDNIERQEGKLTNNSIVKYGEHIREFIFDVKPFIEYLERRTNPNFELFTGWKIYSNTAFELFNTCQALYWYPNIDTKIIDKKAATNLNVFTLRQSMEIKFKRIFGIYELYDEEENDLKFRHDFLPKFIEDNKDLIDLDLPGINMSEVINIYKWTNITIHNAINPRIWEVHYALEITKSFFKGGQYTSKDDKQTLSIYASVKLKNNHILIERLVEAIYNETGRKIFCFDNTKPEAVIDEKH